MNIKKRGWIKMGVVISVKNFSKNYGSFQAIKGIDFDVEQGMIYGFVGKNGAGKSTTIRTMMNMLFPTEGEITINGMDCSKNSKKIMEMTSYMPSDITYYDNLTVTEFLSFILEFSTKTKDDMEELCKFFELNPKKKISELSLGNKKKATLVAMLLKDAELLVLDEPTNGLDPLMQKKFFELILKKKAEGKTIFLSSHNLMEVEKYCDKVCVIKDGVIVDILDMKETKIKYKQSLHYTLKDGTEVNRDIDEDINETVKELAKLDLLSLEIKNKSVEDEFITYYMEEGDKK
jgi:ABC-2 type transport system ATP-binding protein